MNKLITLIYVLPLIAGLVGYLVMAAVMLYKATVAHDKEVEDDLSDLL